MRLIEANAKLDGLVRQINDALPLFKQPLLLKIINFYEDALAHRDQVIEILVEESKAEQEQ